MAQIREEQKQLVAERAKIYSDLVVDTHDAEEDVELAWTHIMDALQEAGKTHLVDKWKATQDVLADVKKQRNAAKPMLSEIVEKIAHEIGALIAKGRGIHEHVEIKHTTFVSFPLDQQGQIKALAWLVERGWGNIITVKLPNNEIKLPGAAPKLDEWKAERHLPVSAVGIPYMVVDTQYPKAYIDGEDKWLPDTDETE